MTTTTVIPPAASYQAAARIRKARVLADHLHALDVDAVEARTMPPAERAMHASYAGTRPPSDVTWGLVVLLLEGDVL